MSLVTAVCRVDRLLPDSGIIGVTAIDKRPVTGSVRVRPLGLRADVQANRKYHGGVDQAVYAYADEDAAYFADLLEREVPPGLFGENLTLAGVDVNGALLGEQWAIGDELVLQATFGRIPCATFQAKMAEPRWVRRFTEVNRTGAYLRVVRPGEVRAGDPVVVLDRPAHAMTIARAFRAFMTEPELIPELLAVDGIPAELRNHLLSRST